MVDAPFDAYLDTPNKSIRQNVPRKGVCLHHAAMTSFSGLESLMMGGKQVSATGGVKDRLSKRFMSDEYRAWSLSSAWGDSSFRSVETCNQSTDGWTISDESHWELAYLVAYWAERDGFWPHRTGDPTTWTVVGHREMYTIWGVSYGTACPGGMDLDLVTRRAQMVLGGSAPAGSGGNPLEDDMTPEQSAQLSAVYSGMYGARNVTNQQTPLWWTNYYGDAQKSDYGILPITIRNQTLIAQTIGLVNGLASAVSQLAVGSGVEIDIEAIKAAAAEGAAGSKLDEEDLVKIAALVVEQLPADADAAAIAEAVREKFRTEPLT